MRMKKTISIILLALLACRGLLAVTLPTSGGTASRFMGLELNKNSGNIFRVVEGESSIPAPNTQDDETFRAWLSGQTNTTLLAFDPYANDTVATPKEKVFTVLYYFESPGTAFVFFSSKGDLGYQDESTEAYTNPYMLRSVDDLHFINYNVTCTSKYSYRTRNEKGQYEWTGNFSTATAQNYTGTAYKPCDTPIDSLEIYDIVSPHDENQPDPNNPNGNLDPSPLMPKVATGVVFRRKVNGGGIRGADTYRLKIMPPQAKTQDKNLFTAGFYTGYIIIHFTAQ